MFLLWVISLPTLPHAFSNKIPTGFLGIETARQSPAFPYNSPMETNVVYRGRCEDVLEDRTKLEENSVGLVLTSPPFWGLRDNTHPDVSAKEVKRWLFGKPYLDKLPEIGLEENPLRDYCEKIGDIMCQ